MEILQLILTTVGGALIALVGSMLYFKPKLKQAQAEASKAETEADKQQFGFMLERIEQLERLYKEQGTALDDYRKRLFKMDEELVEKNKRIVRLEAENKELTNKVNSLQKEVEAYKTINKNR